MSQKSERILLLAAVAGILLLAWFKPLENAATEQADAGLKRALVSFGTARLLNAVLSVAQGTQIDAQPGGLGVTFAPGQILRPVNDLVEQFAELMLAASVVFGLMKVLIGIGSHWLVSLLVSVFAVGWGWLRWRRQRPRLWLGRVFVLLLLVRFAVPLVTVGSDALFRIFLADDYSASQNAIAGHADAVSKLGAPAVDENAKPGLFESFSKWMSDTLDIRGRIDRLKELATQLTEHIVKLIVVFLMQTLVLPLLLFWILLRVGRALVDPGARPH